MKRVFFCAIALAAITLFAACQKDGKYNPKEKIANVYEEGMSIWSYTPDGEQWVSDTSITPKYLSERWTWENDTYTEQTYEDVVKFTYDGSQLTEAASDGERMVFTYDGKKLQKAELFSDGESTPEIAFAFEHDGKKISRFTVTEYDAIDFDVKGKPVVSRLESLLLGSVMPDAKCAQKSSQRQLHFCGRPHLGRRQYRKDDCNVRRPNRNRNIHLRRQEESLSGLCLCS